MKKVEAVIRPGKLEAVKDALDKVGIRGLTVSQVLGAGKQRGRKEIYRGNEYDITLLSKVKIEVVIHDDMLDKVLQAIIDTSRTGEVGDGKIFVYPIENVIRVRTGETGEDAL